MRVATLIVAIVATFSIVAAASDPYCADTIAPIPAIPSSVGTLAQVSVFIRHGDRTQAVPGTCWENDAAVWNCSLSQWTSNAFTPTFKVPPVMFDLTFEKDEEPIRGSCGVGELTEKGRQQQVRNGEELAKAYIEAAGLLSASLTDPSAVYLRADNSHRTQMSGQALANSMLRNSSITLPFYTRDPMYEDIYPNQASCPTVAAANKAYTQSPEYHTLLAQGEQLMGKLSSALGISVSALNLPTVFDCLKTHVCHNMPLPAGFTPDLQANVTKFVSVYGQQLNSYNESLYAKAGAASLMKGLHDAMGAMVAGKPAPAFRLLSGHDTGPIQPVLVALGVYDGEWPPYASRISVELWKLNADSSFAVRLEYNGKVLTPKGCSSELCPWKEFKAVLEGIIPYGSDCLKPEASQSQSLNSFFTH